MGIPEISRYPLNIMLNKIRISSGLFVCASIVAGCGSLQEIPPGGNEPLPNIAQQAITSGHIKNKLYEMFQEWQGVQYRLGGLSKQGIDCSGFVYVTYKSKLGVKLPRTAKLQSKLGTKIHKNNLETGDLVFFKTGMFTKHVGIYLEKNKFLHASLSKGVTISRLDNVYWRSNYWKSVRI
jgi:cell wall-associated NlpC family hydrolase